MLGTDFQAKAPVEEFQTLAIKTDSNVTIKSAVR